MRVPTHLFSRSASQRLISGVASGFAERVGVDPLVVRLALVLLALAGGVGVLLYLAAWALSAPADDYVREFTRNAPRDRILTVGAVASPERVPVNGVNVLASAKIGDAAALVLSSDKAIAVVDADGKPVGAIDRKRMIAALYPDGAR